MPAKVIDIGEWKKKNLPPPPQEPQNPVVVFQGDPAFQGNDMSALVKSLFKNQPQA